MFTSVRTGGGGSGTYWNGSAFVTTSGVKNGTVNTGSGGGGGGRQPGVANDTTGSGGSGSVILKYPDSVTITIGAGLTGSEGSPSGGFKVATITAGTGNVSWA